MCREEARKLAALLPQLQAQGIRPRLIGVRLFSLYIERVPLHSFSSVHAAHRHLYRRTACLLCQVVNDGGFLKGFHPYFPGGDLVLDKDRQIYTAMGGLSMGLSGFFTPHVVYRIVRALRSGAENEHGGEHRYLGGVLVVGAGDAGILYEYKEASWGDHAPLADVMSACQQLPKQSALPSEL